MKHLIFPTLLLLLSPAAWTAEVELNCAKTEYRFEVKSGPPKTGAADLCVNVDGIHLYSASCRDKLATCAKELRDAAPKGENEPLETHPSFGSPGFRNCRKLTGTPRFAEFKIKGSWAKIPSCFLKDDALILDNDTLYGLTH